MKERFYIRLTTADGTYYPFYQAEQEDFEDRIVITSFDRDGSVIAKSEFYRDDITFYRRFPYNPQHGKGNGRRGVDESPGRGSIHETNQVRSKEVGRRSRRHGPLRKAWRSLVSFLDFN